MTETANVAVHHDGYPTHRRKARFNWSDTPVNWIPDDAFASHFWNALHLILPEGERGFIRAVNEAMPLVDDPELIPPMKAFVQQEAWHAGAHQAVLEHLVEQGIDTKRYTDMLEKRLSASTHQHPGWPKFAQRWWLYRRLADVAALEHFTAVLGQFWIESRGLDQAGGDPVMLDLLRWHGAEEVEHRSLVFDVYQNVCGSYLLRACAMLGILPVFIPGWYIGVWFLMRQDSTTTGRPRLRDWLRAAREDKVPGPWSLFGKCTLRYLRPSHHPDSEASTQMALDYLAKSPSALAAREAAEAAQRPGLRGTTH